MVEEADVLLYEGDAQALGRLEDRLVVLAATRSCDVLGSGLGGPVDVVCEGKLRRWSAFVPYMQRKEYLRKRHWTRQHPSAWRATPPAPQQ